MMLMMKKTMLMLYLARVAHVCVRISKLLSAASNDQPNKKYFHAQKRQNISLSIVNSRPKKCDPKVPEVLLKECAEAVGGGEEIIEGFGGSKCASKMIGSDDHK
jgi:hypothetical protein